MLELGQLIGHLDNLSRELARGRDIRADQLTTALAQANMPAADWESQARRINKMHTPFLIAEPLYTAEPVASAFDPAPAPDLYTVVATDGSQIPLDRHQAAPYYVINVGLVTIHYGTGERTQLASDATLFYREADILIGGANGEQSYVGERQIGNRRAQFEMQHLTRLVDQQEQRECTLALVDGTLILWNQEAEADTARDEAVRDMITMLAAAKRCGTFIAGYLSKPGGREVINTLKLSLCPADVTDTSQCKLESHRCEALNRLTDSSLFAALLAPGQRSTVFASRSKILDEYRKKAIDAKYDDPDDYKIGFYYLNTGKEIARVELPLWLAKNPDTVAATHSLVLDQATKGHGYPVALLEAHEQAIVRGPERAAFQELVDRAFVRNGLPVTTSRKALAKQTRIL
ncbi:MAG TPA: DNA double-strand break repair nuclease NurA [Capsulimonadaceae bacterium]|jgi:hypothetical protein